MVNIASKRLRIVVLMVLVGFYDFLDLYVYLVEVSSNPRPFLRLMRKVGILKHEL